MATIADAMNSPEDLQAAGDYDVPAEEPTGLGTPPEERGTVVCIHKHPDGTLSVYDMDGGPDDEVQAANPEEAFTIAGEKLGLNAAPEPTVRQEEGQAMWDQLAAEKAPRGNT